MDSLSTIRDDTAAILHPNDLSLSMPDYTIYIKQATEKDLPLDISPLLSSDSTVAELKQLAFGIDYAHHSLVKFIYCGKLLQDEQKVSKYKINRDDRVNAFVSKREERDKDSEKEKEKEEEEEEEEDIELGGEMREERRLEIMEFRRQRRLGVTVVVEEAE